MSLLTNRRAAGGKPVDFSAYVGLECEGHSVRSLFVDVLAENFSRTASRRQWFSASSISDLHSPKCAACLPSASVVINRGLLYFRARQPQAQSQTVCAQFHLDSPQTQLGPTVTCFSNYNTSAQVYPKAR